MIRTDKQVREEIRSIRDKLQEFVTSPEGPYVETSNGFGTVRNEHATYNIRSAINNWIAHFADELMQRFDD
jgi:hypothetical protein